MIIICTARWFTKHAHPYFFVFNNNELVQNFWNVQNTIYTYRDRVFKFLGFFFHYAPSPVANYILFFKWEPYLPFLFFFTASVVIGESSCAASALMERWRNTWCLYVNLRASGVYFAFFAAVAGATPKNPPTGSLGQTR